MVLKSLKGSVQLHPNYIKLHKKIDDKMNVVLLNEILLFVFKKWSSLTWMSSLMSCSERTELVMSFCLAFRLDRITVTTDF